MRLILLSALAIVMLGGCSRSPEARFLRYVESGKTYLAKRDYTHAIVQLGNARKLKPKSAEVHYQLALAYLGAGEVQSAVRSLEQATRLDPNHRAAKLKLTELMAAFGNNEALVEAERQAQALIASAAAAPEAFETLALAQLRQGKQEQAEKNLLQAVERFPAHLQSAMMLASLKFSQGRWDEAEAELKKAIAANPKLPEPVFALGIVYGSSNKRAEAEAQFRRVLELDPKYAPALVNLGALAMQSGKKAEAEQAYRRAAETGKREFRSVHAVFLFQDGRRSEAVAELEKLAKSDPDDRLVRNRLVAVYVAMGKVDAARQVIERALARNRKDVHALQQRATLNLLSRDLDQAWSDVNSVLRLSGPSAELYYLRAAIARARGQSVAYRQDLEEALKSNPNFLQARVELARTMVGSAPRAALHLLDAAPEKQRNSPVVLQERNWALLALRDPVELKKGIDAALTVARSPDVLLQQALFKIQLRDYPGARTILEDLLSRDAEDLRVLRALISTYTADQTSAALDKVRGYVARKPQSSTLQLFLGELLARAGRIEEARQAFLAAKAVDGRLAVADLGLAYLDVREGRWDLARQKLLGVLTQDSRNLAARSLLAAVEDRSGNWKSAVEHYRVVVQQDPGNVGTLNNLAYLLCERLGQLDEALTYAQRAAELASSNAAVQDTLGWVYYRKGLYNPAVVHLQLAVAGEKNALHQYHLGMAYSGAGDRERAHQAMTAAVKIDPSFQDARAGLEALAKTKR